MNPRQVEVGGVAHSVSAPSCASQRRRGVGSRAVASLMAMLYLMLFSALALGLYAQVNVASQIAANDRRASEALIAAESGLSFVRHHLYALQVPPMTDVSKMYEEIAMQLSDRLDATGNLGGGYIGYDGVTITIPEKGSVPLDEKGTRSFRATITLEGRQLVVKVVGGARADKNSSELNRGVRVRFAAVPIDDSIFDYGVSSKGKVKLGGDFDLAGEVSAIDGSVMSSLVDGLHTPVEVVKDASVSGDVYMADPIGNVKTGGSVSIAGSSDPAVYKAHIHKGIPMPEFPVIDSLLFRPYAVNDYSLIPKPADKTLPLRLTNVIIKPNTNPKIDQDTIVEGVLYIQMPNVVDISKHATVRGVIVVEKSANPADFINKKNVIKFTSGTTLNAIETLPATPQFPASLRALVGSSILAPDTRVEFTGSSGAWAGTVVARDLYFVGHSTGKIGGTVISLGDVKFEKKASLTINLDPVKNSMPAGILLTTRYQPLLPTYEEVRP